MLTGRRVAPHLNTFMSFLLSPDLYVKKFGIILIIIACVLVSGCTEYILSQGSLSIQSDPSGAGIYLDGEFKGTTPAGIHAISSGTHQIELRHDNYPSWNTNVSVITAQTVNITADLSDNLIPVVSIDCSPVLRTNASAGTNPSVLPGSTRCLYKQGEPITIAGTAVRPHPKSNPAVTFVLSRADHSPVFSPLEYSTRINDDTTFAFVIGNTTLPGGTYTITAQIPAGANASVNIAVESPSDTNIRILKEIVASYHATHTYSLPDFYVCADMALDVWNMVRTRGIPAKIAVGNVGQAAAKVNEYNHAWVVAEYSPGDWIAMETTGGYLVPNEVGYYRGIFFETPKDFKTYLDLMKDYNSEVSRIAAIAKDYNAKVEEYNTESAKLNAAVATYNNDYANRALTLSQYQASQTLKSEIDTRRLTVTRLKGELDQLANSLAAEEQVFTGIKSQMDVIVEQGKTL